MILFFIERIKNEAQEFLRSRRSNSLTATEEGIGFRE